MRPERTATRSFARKMGPSGPIRDSLLAPSSPRAVGAVIELCFGRLITNPHRVGHPLGRELEGWCSARVGASRVISVDDATASPPRGSRYQRDTSLLAR